MIFKLISMRRLAFLLFLFGISIVTDAQIIADHHVVDQFDEIPQQYIDSVKTMLVSISGESHASGYQNGLNLLELLDDTYQANTFSSSPAPAVSDHYLRLGSYFLMGENYFFSQGKVEELKDWLTEENTSGNPIDVMGFGWCWDMTWHNAPGGTEDTVYRVHWAGSSVDGPDGDRRWGLDSGDSVLTGNRVNMSTYLASVEQYMKHCTESGYPTQWIFTTGPVDGNEGTETGFQREIKQNYIRDYVTADKSRVLFDFADILCWSDSGEHYMVDWNDEGEIRPHAQLHPDNSLDYDASWNRVPHNEDGDHIGEVGALRLAKAMWWMLARMKGWRAYVPVTGIQLNTESGSSLITTTGGTLQLQALLTPFDATDTTVSWSMIMGSGSASIDSTGLVTALSNGNVTARALANDSSGVYGELNITINDQLNPVREISVIGTDSSSVITKDGGSLLLQAVITPLDATDTTVSWSMIQGTGSASIDSSGLVRALSNGSVTARATANDSSRVYGELQLTISNQITLVGEISVIGADSSSVISTDEGTLRLQAVITPLDATDTTVSWSMIQGTGSASIDSSGLVRALSNGSVTARATATDTSGIYGELLLTISNQITLVDEISVIGADSSSEISTDEGTLRLHAMVTPLDATDTTVSWSLIHGTGSASVDSSGLVRALSNGSVTARATANDTSGIYGEMLLTISNQITLVNEIGISMEGASPLIEEVGGRLQLHALIAPSDATDTTVSWSLIQGTGSANIDSDGMVEALSIGSVTARATANDTSGVYGELDILIGARDTFDLWINPVDPIKIFSQTSTYAGRRAMPVSMPAEGDIESITIYHEGGVGGLILGLYADASGQPGTRLGTSADTTINSSAGWQTIDLLNPVTAGAGETIWLAWVFESNPGIRYESGSPGRAQSSETWSGGMPSDFGGSDQSDYRYSIYCTYTAMHQAELPPASPSDFSASNTTAYSVTLVWTDNSEDETGFELERSDLPGSGFVTIHTTAADITSYLDESVETEHSYYYRLRSVNSHGESDYSPEISVITPAETPGGGSIGYEEVYNQTSVYANRRAMPVTLVENVDIQSITIYHQGGSGGLILGVYEDDSGSPGTRLGLTYTATLSSSQGWQTLSLLNPVSVGAGETIWLAWVFESNPGIRYESGSPGRAQASTTWSSGMPSDFGSSGQSDYRYSIYCTYAPSGHVGTPPAAPSDLSASDTTAYSVTLVWTDNSEDETGFELERSDLPGSGFATILTTAADITGYLDESVEPENTYYYRLRSVNSYGESAYSPEISVLTPADTTVGTPPAAPSDLSASDTTAYSVTLVWTDNSEDETGFELERSDLPGSGFATILTTAADITGYLDESVEPENTYYYRLRSVNSYGESVYSPEISVLTPAELAGGGSIGFEEVYDRISIYAGRRAMPVTLAEDVDIHSISMYHHGGSGGLILGVYEDDSGLPGTRLGITGTAMLNASAGWQTVNLLSPANVGAGETIWLAWVFESNPGIRYESGSPGRAQSSETWGGGMPSEFGSSGESDYRYSIYCTYTSSSYVGAAPAAPSNLSASGVTSSSISLSWTDNSYDETGFELERSDLPGSGFETIQNPAVGVTSYMDESVEPEHTYYYRIRSVNSYGESDYSPEISVSTPAEPIGGNTFGFEEVYDQISVYANRRAMPVTMPEDGYIQSVTIYHQGGSGGLILGVYEDASGMPGTRLGLTGTAALNSSEGWQTLNLLSPLNLGAGETIWLAWVFESNPGIRYESGNPGRAQSSETWGGGMPSAFGSSGQSDYRYSIYASYTTSIVPALKNMTLGVEELNSIEEKVVIYPNPTSGELTLTWKCTYSDGLLLSVYNSMGRLMKNMEIAPGLQSVQINIGDFHKGMYLVVVTDAGKKQVVNQSRVIKIH
jgi:uncharacterized protein YjdB